MPREEIRRFGVEIHIDLLDIFSCLCNTAGLLVTMTRVNNICLRSRVWNQTSWGAQSCNLFYISRRAIIEEAHYKQNWQSVVSLLNPNQICSTYMLTSNQSPISRKAILILAGPSARWCNCITCLIAQSVSCSIVSGSTTLMANEFDSRKTCILNASLKTNSPSFEYLLYNFCLVWTISSFGYFNDFKEIQSALISRLIDSRANEDNGTLGI